MSNKGNLCIIAAPSGAGKTSLVHALVKILPDIKISISHTTRSPRVGEESGKDYFFVDEQEFKAMIKAEKFLEHAVVFGHYYGTSREWVIQQLQQGYDVILEIDWQGARQICQFYPQAVSIFILPPSMYTLAERLKLRAQDSESVINGRLSEAKDEMQHCHEFDYLVINDDFALALEDLRHIICANRLQSANQQQKLAGLLADLLKK